MQDVGALREKARGSWSTFSIIDML